MAMWGTRGGQGQDGSTTVEFVGLLPWLLVGAVFAWQLMLVAASAVSAENAARSAARTLGQGAEWVEVRQAAEDGLTSWLAGRLVDVVRSSDDHIVVEVSVPVLLPGVADDAWTVSGDAVFPTTTVSAGG